MYRISPRGLTLPICAMVAAWLDFSFALRAAQFGSPFIAGEVLVKFKAAPAGPARQAVNHLAGASVKKAFPQIGWQLVKLPADTSVQEGLEHYRALPDVESAEPNYRIEMHGRPNDPKLDTLWGLAKIGAFEAWQTTIGSTNIVVAVMDSGINYNHPDLIANLWRNPGEIPGNGIDDDNNDYIDDVYGIDVKEEDADPLDDDGHGTHVAGTIGAAGNNGVGIVGVNWTVQIMALRIFSPDGFSGDADAVAAYEYTITMKKRGVNLRVINNSWGGSHPSRAMRDAICAAGDAGILSVISAGNDYQNNNLIPAFPAGYDCDSIISVAASGEDDEPAPFTNYGAETVHLAAPGVGVLSTYKGGPYFANFSGTSMSAPHVTGAAALLLSLKPDLTVSELKAILLATVDRLPTWEGKVISGGRLNVGQAMQRLAAGGVNNSNKTGSTVALPATISQPGLHAQADSPNTFPRGITCVSRNSQGRIGNNGSTSLALSADGRFVTFASDATNLVPDDTNSATDIFLHDRLTGSTTRVSESSAGEQANSGSLAPAISADGRFVAFYSVASNLVPGDSNRALDVFVYDRENRQIKRVSIPNSGGQSNGLSVFPSISADGRLVAFVSAATNLVLGDTNGTLDIFVHDRQQKTTTRVSVKSNGIQGNGNSFDPAISADGRFVAFDSDAFNLVSNDLNQAVDIFVHDRETGQTERISVDSLGTEGGDDSVEPSLSADGRLVVFASFASNLVDSDMNEVADVFLHDRQTHVTQRVSIANDGAESDSDCLNPRFSADGRHIIFQSDALMLLPGDVNRVMKIFLFDRLTAKLSQFAINDHGHATTDNSFTPKISADGRVLALASWAYNLVAGDGNAAPDIFVVDRGGARPDLMIRNAGTAEVTGAGMMGIQIVQRKSQSIPEGTQAVYILKLENGGAEAAAFTLTGTGGTDGWTVNFFDAVTGGNSITAPVVAKGWLTPVLAPGVSTNLRLEILAPSLPKGNRSLEVIVNVRATNEVEIADAVRAVTVMPFSPPDLWLASRANDGTPGNDTSRAASLSADGRYVAFSSESSAFVPRDLNRDSDVFVFDRQTQTIECVSKTADGKFANSLSRFPSLSRDGRFVAFQSYADNLTLGETNIREDIFLKDRNTGEVKKVSVASDGTDANHASENVVISGDGRFVAYQSFANNLVPGDPNHSRDIFVWDRTTGKVRCASLASSGAFGNGDSERAVMTPDGRFVAFESYASNFVPDDTNSYTDVFVYDLNLQTLELISATPSGRPGNGPSNGASLSDDGRYVVFSTEADDLLGEAHKVSGAFILDRTTRQLTPLATILNPAGSLGISGAVISPDGRWIAFTARAATAPGQSASPFSNVYLGDRLTGAVKCVSSTRAGAGGDDISQGAMFSADGRYLAFKSWAQNLLSEHTSGASQVLVFDRAAFQPDAWIRRDGAAPFRGTNLFTLAEQSIEQTINDGGTLVFHTAIVNAGSFPDHLRVTGTASVPGMWDAQYFDEVAGSEVTAQVAGGGWDTGELPGGASRQLRVVIRARASAETAKEILLTVASVNDVSKTDQVLVLARPDVDGDGMPDGWEREFFGSPQATTALTDHDGDGVPDGLEYLAGTDPNQLSSVLKLTDATRLAGGKLVLHWASVANRFYSVERAASLNDVFIPIASNLSGTPPENEFTDPLPAGTEKSFYRVRAEQP